MNKAQREVHNILADREDAIARELKSAYKAALDDIRERIQILAADPMSQSKIYQLGYQQNLEKHVSDALKALEKNPGAVEEYLRDVYADSYIGSRYSLNSQGLGIITALNEKQIANTVFKTSGDFTFSQRLYSNVSQLKTQVKAEIARGLSNGSSYHDIARQVGFRTEADYNKAVRIARTEGHRIQSEARLDSMSIAKENGADIVKVWDATLDTHTREDHQAADQQVREIDEQFEVGGYLTDGPGLTGIASEDINCRCIVLEMPRWALESGSKPRRDNETGDVIECRDYAEYREKYLGEVAAPKNKELVFSPAKSLEEAERYVLDNFGIEAHYRKISNISEMFAKNPDFDLDGHFVDWDLDVANAVNRELLRAQELFGKNAFSEIRYIEAMPGKLGKPPYGSFDPVYGRLQLKGVSGKDALNKLGDLQKKRFQSGASTTASALHSFRHELGHALEASMKRLNESDWSAIIREVKNIRMGIIRDVDPSDFAKYLSQYGFQREGEFIPEAIAEFLEGSPRRTAVDVVGALTKEPATGKPVFKLATPRELKGIEKGLVKYDTKGYNSLIGKETPTGDCIENVIDHFYDRSAERGVTSEDIENAINNNLGVTDLDYNEYGEPSVRFVGSKAVVVYNPETKTIVTTWKTKADDLRSVGIKK
jgi:uncharacterized protein with gpF-like domain